MTGTGAVHCKDENHLHTPITTGSAHTGLVTATWMAEMPCKNKGGAQPGIVISFTAGQPLNGLHVYNDAAAWLAGQLDTQASACTGSQNVSIQHPIIGIWHTFITLVPVDTKTLAANITAALSGH